MKRTLMIALICLTMTEFAHAADKAAVPTTVDTTTMVNCGEMAKSMIPLPTKFEELMMAVSQNMAAHADVMSTSTDKNAKAEAKIFRKLASDHKAVAKQMKHIIKNMEEAGKLMPAPHDMSKPDPKAAEGMMNEAKLEREMAALMIKNAEATEKMAATMKGASAKK